MKNTLLVTTLLSASLSFGGELPNGNSDYITEAATLIIQEQAAKDLYNSLKAKAVADPLNTNFQALFTKRNKFATCKIVQYSQDSTDGLVWVIDSATCMIKAPKGTVYTE